MKHRFETYLGIHILHPDVYNILRHNTDVNPVGMVDTNNAGVAQW